MASMAMLNNQKGNDGNYETPQKLMEFFHGIKSDFAAQKHHDIVI